MAYLALARKWRPKAFSEVVGQSHVVQALSNALDSGRVHHAFLFTGTRGVGKTTLARIFAKSLNCEEGTSAEPCQKCSTCTSIDEGRYVDLIEVDAASRTKVDDTRELLENVQYAPTYGKVKVFLIDEVHMLSTHSFNALLKTLEEPPEHVKFLFATTDPQKLPVTVLSRCLQFNLRAMRPEQVENQLVSILGKEGIDFDQAALHAIAKAADGSMRDGLSLLDQAIAQGGGNVNLPDVEGMLGTIKSAHTEAILTALAEHNVDQALSVVADMADCAVDFSVALDDVLMQLYYVSLAQLAPSALSATDANTSLVSNIAQSMTPETLQLFYQIGLISKRDIPLAPSLRVGFEMALLRMLAFEPADNVVASTVPGISSTSASSSESENTEIQKASTEVSSAPEIKTTGVVEAESIPEGIPVTPSENVPAIDIQVAPFAPPEPASENQPQIVSGAQLSDEQVGDQSSSMMAENSNQESAPWLDGPPDYEDSMPRYDAVPPMDESHSGIGSTESPRQATASQQEPQDQPSSPPQAAPQQAVRTPQEFAQAQAAMQQSNDTSVLVATGKSPQLYEQSSPSLVAVTLAGNNEWGELLEQTDLQGFAKELGMNCACERITDEKVLLALSPKVEHLLRDDRVEQIQDSLRKVLKPHLVVTLSVEESDKETPAECLSRLGFEQHEEAVSNIKTDPAVQAIMSEFGATINEQSIKPI
jgi:DNA polymerase-3 subunit gamma/tau